MRCRSFRPIGLTCLVTLLTIAPLRAQEEPAPQPPGAPPLADRLLHAVLGPETESAMVWDWAALGAEQSTLRHAARDWLSELEDVDPGNDPNNIKYVLLRHVAGARPLLQAKGAAQFSRLGDAEELNFINCSIWKVADSLEPLRQVLLTGDGLSSPTQQLELEGVPVFHSRIDVVLGPDATIAEDRYVALLEDTLLLVAENEPDIRRMIRALTGETPPPTEAWGEVLHVHDSKLAAAAAPPAIRIIRRFSAPPAERFGSAWAAAPPMTWMHVLLPAAAEPRFSCTLATPERRAAFDFLSTVFPKEDFRLDATISADRTTVNIRFRHPDRAPQRLHDHLHFLFGDRAAP